MSLCRIALRICAVEALKNNTAVDDAVYDSRHAVLDLSADGNLITDQQKPFIAVYTESSEDKEPQMRSLRSNKALDFVFEYAVMGTAGEINENGEKQLMQGIFATDNGMELVLDGIACDISKTLCDENNEWAEIWRQLSGTIIEVERKRVANGLNGVSLAAHQMRIKCDAINDPDYGEPLTETSTWQQLLNLMEKNNHDFLAPLQKMLGVAGDHSDQRRFGLTLQEAKALMVNS